MKRSVSLLLAFLALLSAFTACSESKEKTDNPLSADPTVSDPESADIPETEAQPEDDYIHDDIPDTDFGGTTVRFVTPTWYNASSFFYSFELNGEAVNDAFYNQRMEIQDRFNVNVDLTVVDDEAGGTHLEQDINNLVAAGDPAYDLVYNGDGPIARNAINGDFLNLRSMSSIDFAKPWFAGSSDVFTIGGKLFFTSNAFSISSIYMNDVLAINKNLAENLGLTVPYDKVRAGTWVMDDLIAMTDGVNQDLNGDGKMTEEDQYGFLTQYYSEMCIQSNLGGSMITKDENGRLAFSADQERVVSIVDQYAKLIENGNDTFGATNEGGAEVFGRGNSLFSYLEARIVYSKVRSYDVNFGILPFPKYNEDQQEYSAAGYDIYWAIPLTTLNTDVAGTVVCAMSCYNYNQIVPLVWEVILGGKLSDMPDDADMFRIMRDVQYVDLGYACSMMKSDLQELVFLLYYTKPGQVASALKKQEKLANRVLENLNKTFDSLGE